jgi:hypothetical protein
MSKTLLAVLLLLTAPALAAETPPPAINLPTTIHVDEAWLGNTSPACDVTQAIKQRCDGRTRCEIEVSKDLCPARRLPGLLQPLRVGYHCRVGEMSRSVIADEPNRLRLLCASNPSRKD